ncbi:hypothetical protein NUJ28_05780 [Burkholderia multivorans]|uniref:hypothetical protein n=1 Tax=Burkholderia multivorans TaxID=87883 RepID=UPI0021D83916|nr:hypothetical protein [Burkholderia multivorans]UXZ62227.1 hypothetical protein NUJ28_05780 [Burkholderia multivorans]
MKKLLPIAAMAIMPIAHAEQPISCSERYETFLTLSGSNRICGFAQELQEKIANFKADALQKCGSSLSDAKRAEIDKTAEAKLTRSFGKYGKDEFCTRVANAIYKSEQANHSIKTSIGKDQAYVFSSIKPANGIIRNSDLLYMLMADKSCPYPYPNYSNMRLAFVFNPAKKNPDPGCWGKTTDPSGTEALVIDRTGNISGSLNLLSFYRVWIDDAGDAHVLGPAMTQEERDRNIAEYKKSFR